MSFLYTFRYQKGTIPGAVHAPFQSSLTQDGRLSSPAVKEFLDEYRYQVKVVVDTSNTQCGEVSGG